MIIVTKLLIVDSLDNPCCPTDTEPKKVELDFVFPDETEGVDIKLLYSKNSDTYLIPMEILQHIFSEAPDEFFQVQHFEIDSHKVSTAICTPAGETKSWQEAMEVFQLQAKPPMLAPKDIDNYMQSDDVWEFITAFAGRVGEDAEVATIALIVNAQGAIIRQQVVIGQIKVETIAQLVLQAIVYPLAITDADKPNIRIPETILVADQTDFVLLSSVLDNLNLSQFDVNIHPEQAETPIANEIVQDLQNAMKVPARILKDVAKETLIDYFEATYIFYNNEYWHRVEENRYLGFQITKDGEAGDWHYINFMGQMGEEFGIAIFESWLDICKLESNIPSPMSMMSMMLDKEPYVPKGSREAISLTEIEFLHPDDEDAVLNLDNHKKYSFDGEYPLPMRLGAGGVESPELSLENYTYLLQAIHEVFSKRRADVIKSIKKTVDLGDCIVSLRYPAKGNEAFVDSPEAQNVGTYRFTIIGKNSSSDFIGQPKLSQGKKVQVELSGDATAYDFTKAIKKQLDMYIEGFCIIEDEESLEELTKATEEQDIDGLERLVNLRDVNDFITRLWSRNDVYSAKPYISQLAALAEKEPVYVTAWLELYELHIERISDSPRPKDDIICISK